MYMKIYTFRTKHPFQTVEKPTSWKLDVITLGKKHGNFDPQDICCF